ncbi:MAG: hypothetical protein EGQ84_00635 [Slackia sp.]|nr:hypothetical protein [Slackia sp.]
MNGRGQCIRKGIENSRRDIGAATTVISAAETLKDSAQPVLNSDEDKVATEKAKDTLMKNRN